ncbi:hypothetical protein HAX54_034302 [Datura stramonium]|uniref:Metallo-beta-lactamase domain-containing protein n=1 Tax=Datura stramonium TaxID=4076 RepID=A0ABS8VEZ1_DATST|nr:hypothetical protein [Datura stramonium]
MATADNGNAQPQSALIFLGTGCSSAVPNALCLIRPDPPCTVCSQSLTVPPEENPNYRCNTSLLIDYCKDNGEQKYILIDVGKTFREQVLRVVHCYRIPQVDSVLSQNLCFERNSQYAALSLVQPFSPTNDIDPTPVYLSQYSMDSIVHKFPYLVQKKLKEGQEIRRVAQLDWQIIENDCGKPFVASGLEFVPLPETYYPLTLFELHSAILERIDIYKNGSHNVHLCLTQTLEALKMLCPKRALLIGMTHEFDHHKDNEFLVEWSRREGIAVQLAHDGLRVPVDL